MSEEEILAKIRELNVRIESSGDIELEKILATYVVAYRLAVIGNRLLGSDPR